MSEVNVPKEPEQRWPRLELDKVPDDRAKELALGVVEQAVCDWKDMCKKLPKKKLCMEEINKRMCMFDEIRRFLNSRWCSTLLGNGLRRSLIVAELERKYQESSFLKQAEAFKAKEGTC